MRNSRRLLDIVLVVLPPAWSAVIIVAVVVGCCAQNAPAIDEMPRAASCAEYQADIRGVADDLVVPSIVPAPFGVRIIVPVDFDPFMGSSVLVPGGRMAWNAWVYHWFDGDHLGAIGRVGNTGECRWYDPL